MMKFKVLAMLEKELLNLKGSKLAQILCTDKTGFCRVGHICSYIAIAPTYVCVYSERGFNIFIAHVKDNSPYLI